MPDSHDTEHQLSFNNSSFTEVQGNIINVQNHNIYAENVSIDRSEAGLLKLFETSSSGAAFDSLERTPPPKCHPGTREVILTEINEWIGVEPSATGTKLCWLHGPAGAGKSAVAQTVSESASQKNHLAASFFFSRSSPSRNHSQNFFTTLAFQLASSIPEIRSHINKAIEDDIQIIRRRHSTQSKQLIAQPFQSLQTSLQTPPSPFLVIVDGLDECGNSREQTELLTQILELLETYAVPLRFLIVSRPEQHIRAFFDTHIPGDIRTETSLYGDFRAQEDVARFLRDGFHEMHTSGRHSDVLNSVSEPWPPEAVLEALVKRSDGYFIYASTVLKYIDDEDASCVRRLEEVLGVSPIHSAPFAELDNLYLQILSKCPDPERLVRILGGLLIPVHRSSWSKTWLVTYSMAETIETVATLSGLHSGEILVALRCLRSVLKFEERRSGTKVFPVHASFMEFLSDKSRAGRYHLNFDEVHADLAWAATERILNWNKTLECSTEFDAAYVRDSTFWFRSGSVMVPRAFLLIQTLVEHLKVPTSAQQSLFERAREAVDYWNPWISGSDCWPSPSQILLMNDLGNSIRDLKNYRSSCHVELQDSVTALRASFMKVLDDGFRSLETSSITLATIQTILIIPGRSAHYFSSSRSRAEVDESLGLSGLVDITPHPYLIGFFFRSGSLYRLSAAGKRLVEFLTDRKRCGELLYSEIGGWYARLTNHWLLWYSKNAQNSDEDDPRPVPWTISRHWSYYLTMSTLGDEQLISRLREFNLSQADPDDRHHVQEWLQKSTNVPDDVMLRWKVPASVACTPENADELLTPPAATQVPEPQPINIFMKAAVFLLDLHRFLPLLPLLRLPHVFASPTTPPSSSTPRADSS